MKFAFSSNAFLQCTLSETISLLAGIGYQGIEIMADVPHAYPLYFTGEDIRQTRKLLAEKRIEISNINAFMHNADGDTYHPSWIEKDPAERARRIEYTLRCIDLAEKLGAPHISTEPGGPLEGISREEGISHFLDGLRAVEGRARRKGIKILIEPEPGLLIENSSEFLEIYRRLDPAVFGLNFDIGHFFCAGEDPVRPCIAAKGLRVPFPPRGYRLFTKASPSYAGRGGHRYSRRTGNHKEYWVCGLRHGGALYVFAKCRRGCKARLSIPGRLERKELTVRHLLAILVIHQA